jgi:hypothetical protein
MEAEQFLQFLPVDGADALVRCEPLVLLFEALKDSAHVADTYVRCTVLERGGFCERLTKALHGADLEGDIVPYACDLLMFIVENLQSQPDMFDQRLSVQAQLAPDTYYAAVEAFWGRSEMLVAGAMNQVCAAVLQLGNTPRSWHLEPVFELLREVCEVAYAAFDTNLYDTALKDMRWLPVISMHIAEPLADTAAQFLFECLSFATAEAESQYYEDGFWPELKAARLLEHIASHLKHLLDLLCSPRPLTYRHSKSGLMVLALKIASLTPLAESAAMNEAVVAIVRTITLLGTMIGMKLDNSGDSASPRETNDMLITAFGKLKDLFAVSDTAAVNDAALTASRSGASTPAFKTVAANMADGAAVMSYINKAAVAAADAAMAKLLAEEEGERSAAAQPRKSKKKKKPQATGGAAGGTSPEAAAAAASPAAPPPAAVPPLQLSSASPAAAPSPAARAAVQPPPPHRPPPAAAADAPPPPPLAATAAAASTLPPPPRAAAPAAAPPPLPAYLAASRLAAAAAAPPAPPPSAAVALPPPPAAPARATKECCVCLDDVPPMELLLLYPCGHRCVCQACADALVAVDAAARRCPKCRVAVAGAARVFEE